MHLLRKTLKRRPDDAASDSAQEGSSAMTQKLFTKTVDLARHLRITRTVRDMDLLAHIGFIKDDWSTVFDALSRLLDAVDSLKDASDAQTGTQKDLNSVSSRSLDELTDVDSKSSLPIQHSRITEMTSLDALTYRPFAHDYSKLLMAETWKSLGAIVLRAAESEPTKSNLAMSLVYRILARLHHSGLIPERVYHYATPDSHQVTSRPPGMHLLSSHIMDVLSDAAWLMHEAETAAKAAAEGQDAPFLPAKIGIKELGHNIWLEFILWCCVEQGHISEGIWLAKLLKNREGSGWKFQSWQSLLRNEESLRATRIDQDLSFWPSPDSENAVNSQRKRTDPPVPFYGLGKQTISVEVIEALLDNLPNLVQMGMGKPGVPASELLHQATNLKFANLPSDASDSELLPTIKSANWYITRVMESGGLEPEADPQMFDEFIKLTPHIVPPWSDGVYPVEEKSLAKLDPSELYDGTFAFIGLMESNLKSHATQRYCGSGLNLFAMFQAVVDACKMRRVNDFFSEQATHINADLPSTVGSSFASLDSVESSTPRLSNVTMAHLFDMVTASRAFAFGEWLLFSDDVDGPAVPASAYSDQALAPSLLRFAAATKNKRLGDSTIQALKLIESPSNNTYRAMVNHHIVSHQWDQVVAILSILRDRRAKSWMHSNVATMAAEIIRLEKALQRQRTLDKKSSIVADLGTNLADAIRILYRILSGEFDERYWLKSRSRSFQQNATLSYIRLFRRSKSRSLYKVSAFFMEEIHVPRRRLPYIPPPAFHIILAAIAETQSARRVRVFYKNFCEDVRSPKSDLRLSGGITRFYRKSERDYDRGDPNFDPQSTSSQDRLVLPNPNTVRIVFQAAARDYQDSIAAAEAKPETDQTSRLPTKLEAQQRSAVYDLRSRRNLGVLGEAERTLVFCIKTFRAFHMSETEIAREVGEGLYGSLVVVQGLAENQEAIEAIEKAIELLVRRKRKQRLRLQKEDPENTKMFPQMTESIQPQLDGPLDRAKSARLRELGIHPDPIPPVADPPDPQLQRPSERAGPWHQWESETDVQSNSPNFNPQRSRLQKPLRQNRPWHQRKFR